MPTVERVFRAKGPPPWGDLTGLVTATKLSDDDDGIYSLEIEGAPLHVTLFTSRDGLAAIAGAIRDVLSRS